MKANVREDIIRSIGGGQTEIGRIPRGVPLDRLRWDGEKLVDLDDYSTMWVRHIGGRFELHAVQVPGSQQVNMRYEQSNLLRMDDGTIRLMTPAEITARQVRRANALRHNRLSGNVRNLSESLLLDVTKLLYALIIVELTGNAQMLAWLTSHLSDFSGTFDWSKERARLDVLIPKLKEKMDDFYGG